jgi:hypothetical protein
MQFQASPCAQDFPGLTAIALLVLKELFCQFGNHNTDLRVDISLLKSLVDNLEKPRSQLETISAGNPREDIYKCADRRSVSGPKKGWQKYA